MEINALAADVQPCSGSAIRSPRGRHADRREVNPFASGSFYCTHLLTTASGAAA